MVVSLLRVPGTIIRWTGRLLPGMSLRLRLTLWYSLTLAVTLWLFTGFLYAVLAQILAGEIDKSLVDRALEVNRSIRLETVFERNPMPRKTIRLSIPSPDVFAASDTFVQVASLDGEVVATSTNLGDEMIPVDPPVVAAARSGRIYYETIEIKGHRFRLLSTPVIAANQIVGVLQVGRSLASYETVLGWLRIITILGGIASVACSALVGSALARAALRPIERLARTAEEIGQSQDFSRRVDGGASNDEVGRLAATFNAMLDRLQAAYAGLEAALASQRRFVADASHELRTPLTTIRGNAGLLQQFPDMAPDDRIAALAQIASESDRMARLVQDLLVLARADAGQRLEREVVALRPIVLDVVRQARLMRDGVTVAAGCVDDLAVLGNADALRQLLLILVDNATKYTPDGGFVSLSLTQNGEQATLEVADTGVGIAPEDLPHIFERFYRADRARSAGGTGLGLSIARWIVDEHGGSIDVTSEPGKGSVFRVSMPLAEVKSYPTLTTA